MRPINVSTDVYAKIWSLRKEREETEDEILQRVLDVSAGKEGVSPDVVNLELIREDIGGFHDLKNDVHFREGFEIFRFYMGTEYRARATKGHWLLLNNNNLYPSLHKLSQAVVTGNENSWMNWKYEKSTGETALITELRDQSKISQRAKKPTVTLNDF